MTERHLGLEAERGETDGSSALAVRLYPAALGWNRSRLNISSGLVMKNGPTTSASDTACAPAPTAAAESHGCERALPDLLSRPASLDSV